MESKVTITQVYNFLKDEWKYEKTDIKFPYIREFGEEYGEFKSFKI